MKAIGGAYADRIDGDGATLEQIAEAEGVSRSTVWLILQSAYRKLRRDRHAIEILQAAAMEAAAQRARRAISERP